MAGEADRTVASADQEAIVLVVVAGEDYQVSVAAEMAVDPTETEMSGPQIAWMARHESEIVGTVEC